LIHAVIGPVEEILYTWLCISVAIMSLDQTLCIRVCDTHLNRMICRQFCVQNVP